MIGIINECCIIPHEAEIHASTKGTKNENAAAVPDHKLQPFLACGESYRSSRARLLGAATNTTRSETQACYFAYGSEGMRNSSTWGRGQEHIKSTQALAKQLVVRNDGHYDRRDHKNSFDRSRSLVNRKQQVTPIL